MSTYFDLTDRVVIITGASRGIGKGTAEAVSHSGGKVVLVARTADDLEAVAASLPGESAVVVGSVDDPDVAARAVAAACALGDVWGLVNNAGISPYYHPAVETTDDEWDHVLRVNLRAAAMFARAVVPAMLDTGRGGRIVNLSSIAAFAGLPNIVAYNATKAALDSMTRTLAVELGPSGILVNSIAPGTITTELVGELMAANPALAEKFVSKTAMGRVGTVAEAAWPIVFLLSDAAGFMTGQVLLVDGGRLAAA
ncbi:MAG: glucose 1-dehydrogenase [Thermoleophilia bacterium]|nr:glucose 1-dehydrogenase [Thermoleophilia bacterium]